MPKDTSWGSVAGWYDELLADSDGYQKKVILPNLTRLAGDVKGKNILDLAAGQGFFSEAFSKAGASVTAVEISAELAALARKRIGDLVKFFTGSAEILPSEIGKETFDFALCVLSLQNIRDMSAVFSESSRVLKKGGKFLIVLNHPAFRIPGESSWGFDEVKKTQYRRLDGYLSESQTEIVMHPGDKKSPKTISFHRPLQLYFKTFTKYGFVCERLEEWISHKESEKGPRKFAEDRARKEFPLFLYLGLVKQ